MGFLSCSFPQELVHWLSCSSLMGSQGEIWNVSPFKGCFYWLWPLPHVFQDLEISLILFQNTLKKLWLLQRTTSCPKITINGETKSVSKAGLYIVELYHSYFKILTIRKNIIHDEALNVSVLNAFLRFWTYKMQWHNIVSTEQTS